VPRSAECSRRSAQLVERRKSGSQELVERDDGLVHRLDPREVQGGPANRGDGDAATPGHLGGRERPSRDPDPTHASGAAFRSESALDVVVRSGEVDAPEHAGTTSADHGAGKRQAGRRSRPPCVVDGQ